jgi:uncharacterized protein involved in high-affinity Fe2+ transport
MPKTESNLAKRVRQAGGISVIVWCGAVTVYTPNLVQAKITAIKKNRDMMPVEMRLLYFEPVTMRVDRVKCFKFRNDIHIFHVAIVV